MSGVYNKHSAVSNATEIQTNINWQNNGLMSSATGLGVSDLSNTTLTLVLLLI